MQVCDIFKSINGEVCHEHQGSVTTFLRLQGCNLRCKHCDTKYSQEPEKGTEMKWQDVASKILSIGCSRITITGGEPLLQRKELKKLTDYLFGSTACRISIETNGTLPIYPGPLWVIDYKMKGFSGKPVAAPEDFIKKVIGRHSLADYNYIKFVVADWNDFYCAVEIMRALRKDPRTEAARFAFSPCSPTINPAELADRLVSNLDTQNAILNLQLHKILWPKSGEGDEK